MALKCHRAIRCIMEKQKQILWSVLATRRTGFIQIRFTAFVSDLQVLFSHFDKQLFNRCRFIALSFALHVFINKEHKSSGTDVSRSRHAWVMSHVNACKTNSVWITRANSHKERTLTGFTATLEEFASCLL